MDPPWGGLNYKTIKELPLYMGNMFVGDLVADIKKKKLARYVVIKVPNNFTFELFYQKVGRRYCQIENIMGKYTVLYCIFDTSKSRRSSSKRRSASKRSQRTLSKHFLETYSKSEMYQ